MNFDYFMTYLTIVLSRKIPKQFKKELLNRLVKEDTTFVSWKQEDTKKIKYLFYSGMFYRAYDIFLTSIFAFLNNKEISINLLIRAQLENIFLTNYIIKNPTELIDIFKNPIKIKKTKSSMDEKDYFKKLYSDLSQKAHSFPEGLKSCYNNTYMLNFKEMKWVPSLAVKSHYYDMEKESKEVVLKWIMDTFDTVNENLNLIKQSTNNDEVKDFSEIHRKTV